MKEKFRKGVVLLICFGVLAWIAACSDNNNSGQSSQGNSNQQVTDNSASDAGSPSTSEENPAFLIHAGSEMSGLEPMIMTWAKKMGYPIHMAYKGSIDMMRMMADGTNTPTDAYWPAHAIWFILGDTEHVIKNKRSMMVSPIVVGLKESIVKRLDWDKSDPTLEAFLEAAQKGEFKFAKTSSTQSNSGALFHLAAWWAFAGKPDLWSMDIVNNSDIQAKVKAMEGSVAATSGSSGWLKSKLIADYDSLDGMVNYEAMISEANVGWRTIDKHTRKEVTHKGLKALGKEPLHVVYLQDATMMADHPLGYVDKGNAAKAKIFEALQAFLLSTEAQKEMIRLGRRNRLLAMDASLADNNAFNPDDGFDVERVIAPIQPPREDVLMAILDLYQEELRKPSATFWVIDDSGSMYKNGGKEAVQAAMSILLTPSKARQFKLQPTAKDIHGVIPFSNRAGEGLLAKGNDPGVLAALMEGIRKIQLGGGTDMYAGVMAALEVIKARESELTDHFPAIAVLSDGISDGSIERVLKRRKELNLTYIPVHTLSFGSGVDEKQLKELAALCGGRYFSGKKDVAHAFRKMKGYN